MSILRLYRLAAVPAVLALLAGISSAADLSFTGTFSQDDQLEIFTFTVNTGSEVIGRR
jgi:hypothetical protein